MVQGKLSPAPPTSFFRHQLHLYLLCRWQKIHIFSSRKKKKQNEHYLTSQRTSIEKKDPCIFCSINIKLQTIESGALLHVCISLAHERYWYYVAFFSSSILQQDLSSTNTSLPEWKCVHKIIPEGSNDEQHRKKKKMLVVIIIYIFSVELTFRQGIFFPSMK